ncbi:conserved hypothetical protein [Microcystis aeruginosa PCC 9807]|uniref:DUF3110 domain-containing protein n=1 Tax=Microcystis aeruginosa PCC 9807 TaxID=1160283 RepID=I4H514_MICAE|nr:MULTISPECIES: DUF3110 domain-containing protein [Microcystis]TRT72535.1 MAG: DUF3110 domain-containing protein [Microcystis sp. M_OC_Ca_00000000_S217Cul]TRT82566.1 MAG: DUF3110 domain-containing protein [Microcystis sp. M_OC_Ca_00000000_C217Col]CCI17138.1 conserved hypothetical protein [Microcystis aeruginosa PCC 9807]
MRVFVLLFNAGTENEGIHTIQMGAINKVLMFESEDDATRYALLLEAQDFPTPTVEKIDSEEVAEFCRGAGYQAEMIAAGMLVIPPESNAEELDWQKEEVPLAEEEFSEIPDAELDSIRRRLEGLL